MLLKVALQGQALLDGVLELLLDLIDSGLMLFACSPLLGRLVLSLSQRPLEASTLIVAPNKFHGTLVSMNHSSFVNIYKVTAYLDCPPAASSRGRALLRPTLDSASVRRIPQYERS